MRTSGLVGVVVGSLLLVGCGSTEQRVATSGSSPSASSTTPSATTAPLSPKAEYQKKLTQMDVRLSVAYEGLVTITDPSKLGDKRSNLNLAVTMETHTMTVLQPPAEAAAAHRALQQALTALNTSMGSFDVKCAGLALTVQGIQRGMETKLRPALNQLAKLGLRAGTFLPKKLPPAPVITRPDNGTTIVRSGSRGAGRLRVDNAGTADVAVSVVTGGKPASPHVMTYVRAGKVATVSGIRGGYQLYFKSGADWNPKTRQFTDSCTFQKFDQPFPANQSWQISLKPVIGGNASTSEVDGY
ncbi:hypothetical protein ACIBL3_26710 [Kribbella sp. NPDC050124]|uniref:hypothetical protein n=1 Tax=Kribbella sp. NPDC050124 TaxID=3364114 RepID=UPI0037881D15